VAEGAAHAGDGEFEPDLLQGRGVPRLQALLDEVEHCSARNPFALDALDDLGRRERGVGRAISDVQGADRVVLWSRSLTCIDIDSSSRDGLGNCPWAYCSREKGGRLVWRPLEGPAVGEGDLEPAADVENLDLCAPPFALEQEVDVRLADVEAF